MDIGRIGGNVIKLPEYSRQQKKTLNKSGETGVVLELNTTKAVGSESMSVYTNTKLRSDAQLIERFSGFTNKQIGGQLGSLKAYIQGFVDARGADEESIELLENLLLERYGLVADLDPKGVEEGGYYSPENLSDRLVAFAKNISGGDASKAQMLMDAVKKGFELAEETWGGQLPEISRQTYDLTMSKFEDWASTLA